MTGNRPFFQKTTISKLLLALAIGSFFSCHGPKKAVEAAPATEDRSANFLVKKIEAATLPADRLSCRAAIKLRSDGQNLDATANLFWVRDSCLWVQVKKFGIEGARALIRRDSVFLINRLEQTYMAEGIDFLEKKYRLPASFEAIDALVLGRAWLFPQSKIETTIEGGLHKITVAEREGRFLETLFVKNEPFLLEKLIVAPPSGGQSVTARFDGWRPGPGGLGHFSFLRTVEFGDAATGFTRVEAELSDLQLFPTKKFRFEIPAHYKRARLGG